MSVVVAGGGGTRGGEARCAKWGDATCGGATSPSVPARRIACRPRQREHQNVEWFREGVIFKADRLYKRVDLHPSRHTTESLYTEVKSLYTIGVRGRDVPQRASPPHCLPHRRRSFVRLKEPNLKDVRSSRFSGVGVHGGSTACRPRQRDHQRHYQNRQL